MPQPPPQPARRPPGCRNQDDLDVHRFHPVSGHPHRLRRHGLLPTRRLTPRLPGKGAITQCGTKDNGHRALAWQVRRRPPQPDPRPRGGAAEVRECHVNGVAPFGMDSSHRARGHPPAGQGHGLGPGLREAGACTDPPVEGQGDSPLGHRVPGRLTGAFLAPSALALGVVRSRGTRNEPLCAVTSPRVVRSCAVRPVRTRRRTGPGPPCYVLAPPIGTPDMEQDSGAWGPLPRPSAQATPLARYARGSRWTISYATPGGKRPRCAEDLLQTGPTTPPEIRPVACGAQPGRGRAVHAANGRIRYSSRRNPT